MFSRKKSGRKSDKKEKPSSSSHRSHRSSTQHGQHLSHERKDPIEECVDEPDDEDGDEDAEADSDTEALLESVPQNLTSPLSYNLNPSLSSDTQTYSQSSTYDQSYSSGAQTSNPSSSRQPDYYYDIGIPATLGSLVLTSFRVVSHSTGPIIGQEPHSASHWSIYLIYNSGSVRLSMDIDQRPEIPYPRGRLSIYTYNYISSSNSAVRFWDFPVIRNVTVKDVYLTIGSHRRQLYDMGDNGRGCRFWVQHVMIDMETAGYITGNTRDIDYIEDIKIEDIIEYRYSRGVQRVPFPMIEGTFL